MRRWKAHRGEIASVSFSRDGAYLASVTGSGRDIFVWNPTDGTRVRLLTTIDKLGRPSYDRALAVSFAPDVDLLAVSRYDWIEVWNVLNWERLSEHQCANDISISREIALSRGHDPLLACSSRTVGVLQIEREGVENARLLRTTSWPVESVTQLSFSTDGLQLATHTLERVQVWNPEIGVLLKEAQHKRANYAGPVRFSPDSTRLAFCSTKTIESWPAALDDPKAVIRYVGHTDKVWMLRYTPDGRRLISASSDGTVREWEAATGAEIRCFEWKVGKIAAADVSPDGMIAAVGGANGEIVVWDLE